MSSDLFDREVAERMGTLAPTDRIEPGIWTGFVRGGLQTARAAALRGLSGLDILGAVGPIAQDAFTNGTEAQDKYFAEHEDIYTRGIEDITPKPDEVGVAGRVTGELLGTLPFILAAPAPAIGGLSVGETEQLMRQGVPTGQAAAVGAVTAATLGLGLRVPILGRTLAQRMLLGGAGFNVLQGTITRGAQSQILKDHPEIADMYGAFKPEYLTLDILLGLAFGGFAHVSPEMRAQGARELDLIQKWLQGTSAGEREALATMRQAQHMGADSLPGRPVEPKDAQFHVERVRQAMEQATRNEPINVSDLPEPRVEPFDDGPTPQQNLDAELDRLADEKSALLDARVLEGRNKVKDASPLELALGQVASTGLDNEGSLEAARWAIANGRMDIAKAIAARLERAAQRAEGARSTLPETSPKRKASEEALAKSASESRTAADEAASLLRGGEPDVHAERAANLRQLASAAEQVRKQENIPPVPRELTEGPAAEGRAKPPPPPGEVRPGAAGPEAIRIESAEGLSDSERAIEERFAKQITADPADAVRRYEALRGTEGGKVLNTDLARELSTDYSASNEARAQFSRAVHEPASALVKMMYAQKLAQPPGPDELPMVTFTAGGTGAGKTGAISRTQLAAEIAKVSQIVYDTNMNTLKSSIEKVEMALAAGKRVNIIYVGRDPLESFRGAIERAKLIGRTVPIEEHAKTHVGAPLVSEQLMERYAGNEKVQFVHIDNSGAKGDVRVIEQPKARAYLKSFNADNLIKRLSNELETQRQAGTVSDSIYAGFAGDGAAGGGRVPGATRGEIPAGEHAGIREAAIKVVEADPERLIATGTDAHGDPVYQTLREYLDGALLDAQDAREDINLIEAAASCLHGRA